MFRYRKPLLFFWKFIVDVHRFRCYVQSIISPEHGYSESIVQDTLVFDSEHGHMS